ncbi:MAG: hypothetical protein ABIE22_02540 [archaeon]
MIEQVKTERFKYIFGPFETVSVGDPMRAWSEGGLSELAGFVNEKKLDRSVPGRDVMADRFVGVYENIDFYAETGFAMIYQDEESRKAIENLGNKREAARHKVREGYESFANMAREKLSEMFGVEDRNLIFNLIALGFNPYEIGEEKARSYVNGRPRIKLFRLDDIPEFEKKGDMLLNPLITEIRENGGGGVQAKAGLMVRDFEEALMEYGLTRIQYLAYRSLKEYVKAPEKATLCFGGAYYPGMFDDL